MIKSFIRLFIFCCVFATLLTLSNFSRGFAFPRADDSWQPTRILYSNIKNFFGDLKGTFRARNSRLSLQTAEGLENDQLSGRQVFQLPKVGNGLYLESGSTETYFPLFSAILVTPSERVVSAALLDSAGLTIFLRSSKQNNLYIAVSKRWAQDLWCSESPVYGGLGLSMKVNQAFDPSNCRPLKVQAIYLTGYGNKSVN